MNDSNNPLADCPEFILAYMAPMAGPGAPYRNELIRRQQNGTATGERIGYCFDKKRKGNL